MYLSSLVFTIAIQKSDRIIFYSRSEVGILTSTALLNRIIRQVTSEALLQEMVYFLLGEETGPETLAGTTQNPLRHRLIEHCDHLSDEVILAAMTA